MKTIVRALSVFGWLRLSIPLAVFGVWYLATGNTAGRVIGAVLLLILGAFMILATRTRTEKRR